MPSVRAPRAFPLLLSFSALLLCLTFIASTPLPPLSQGWVQKHHGVVAGKLSDAEKSLLQGRSFRGDRTDPLHINAMLSDNEVPAEKVSYVCVTLV